MFLKNVFMVVGVLLVLYFMIVLCIHFFPPSVSSKSIGVFDEEILKKFQTGDMIFLSGNTFGDKVLRTFGRCAFSHVGLIVKENGRLYVWEADVGGDYKSGARLLPFENVMGRKKYYNGTFTTIGIRRIRSPVNDSTILSIINTHRELLFDNTFRDWIFSSEMFKDKNKVFCSELVHLTLQKLNVIRSTEKSFRISPKNLVDMYSDVYHNIEYYKYRKM